MFDAFTARSLKHVILDRRDFMAVAAGLVASGALPKSALALAGPYGFKQGLMTLPW